MNNNVIEIKNFKEDPSYIMEFWIAKDTGKDKPETIEIVSNNENWEEIFKEIDDKRTVCVGEHINIYHGKYLYTFSIMTSMINYNTSVLVTRADALNKSDEYLLEPIDIEKPIEEKEYYFNIYVNNISDLFKDTSSNLTYISIFGKKKFTFRDYSQAPYCYDGKGYISINNGDKYPLVTTDIDNEGRTVPIEITQDIIPKIRARSNSEEVYTGLMSSMDILPMFFYYPNSDLRIIRLLRPSIQGSVDINIKDNIIEDFIEKEEYINNYGKVGFDIVKESDNNYIITLDYDWLSDLIEVRDGYGNHYRIERYQRLKVIK